MSSTNNALSCTLSEFLQAGAFYQISPSEVLVMWDPLFRSSNPDSKYLSLYAPDFFLKDKKPWFIWKKGKVVNLRELKNLLEFQEDISWSWQSVEENEFAQRFDRAHQWIQSGEFEKLVPVVFQTGECHFNSSKMVQFLVRQALAHKDSATAYGLWLEGEGIIGITPEVFMETDFKTFVKSMALAGTRPKTHPITRQSQRTELMKDPKELHEHELVVQDIQSVLELFGPVSHLDTQVLSLTHLEHLQTEIHCRLNQPVEFDQLVQSLHPTPALGSYPRSQNLNVIDELDQGIGRSRFGAPFGVRGLDGTFKSVVAIRNIQWKGSACRIGAGCGIVRESLEPREWNEIKAKAHSVGAMLGLL